MQLRRLAQRHSTDAHADPVERLTQRGWREEIGRSEADLSGYLWHFFEQVDRHAIRRIEVNPETIEGNECVVASNSLSHRHNLPDEAGDLGHKQLKSPASAPLI